MKKKIIFMLSVVLLITILLVSCDSTNDTMNSSNDAQIDNDESYASTTTGEKAVSLAEYSALVYEYSVSEGSSQSKLKMYKGEKFNYGVISKKKNMPQKEIKILKEEYPLFYNYTKTYNDRFYNIDGYNCLDSEEGLYIFADYRTDTNQLVKYSQVSAKNPNYASAVNPASSESEYVAYAKKIILDNTGFSLDGWSVRVESYSDSHGIEDKFVNYEKASLTTTYTFTFYKTIDGIERCDKTVITMTNMGEIISFEVMPNDEAFVPYMDVKIDVDKVKETVLQANSPMATDSKEIEKMELVTNEDGLWVKATVYYTLYGGEKSGLSFVVQVAEIEKTPLSADKIQ